MINNLKFKKMEQKVKRITLTDGTGRWFDAEKAEYWKEGEEWDGSNWISLATGTQWNHERLYKTAGNRFILNCWSKFQGVLETYEEISKEEAARWLAINKHEPDELCAEEFANLEIK